MKTTKTKAVFLDRDGVINHEVGNIYRVADFTFLPRAAKAVKKLNNAGYKVIVITNQGAIAKGIATHKNVRDIHAAMKRGSKKEGARIDAIYYCPHHPKGSVKRYAIQCDCRKPGIGMIKAAQKKFNIDMKKSFLVGDTTGDILAGRRAGLHTILVRTGHGGKDGRHKAMPHDIVRDIFAAANLIVKHA
jgi:histidinol-phosphate phosphatase family protein